MRREILTGLALTGASLLSACGEDDSSPVDRSEQTAIVDSNTSASDIDVTYYEDGSRELVIPAFFAGRGMSEVRVLQWCIGTDLITNSQQNYDDVQYGQGGAGGTTVNPEYTPCADGRLTPSDFEIQE